MHGFAQQTLSESRIHCIPQLPFDRIGWIIADSFNTTYLLQSYENIESLALTEKKFIGINLYW